MIPIITVVKDHLKVVVAAERILVDRKEEDRLLRDVAEPESVRAPICNHKAMNLRVREHSLAQEENFDVVADSRTLLANDFGHRLLQIL